MNLKFRLNTDHILFPAITAIVWNAIFKVIYFLFGLIVNPMK